MINIWDDYATHTNDVTNALISFTTNNEALGIHSGHAYSLKNLVHSGSTIDYVEVVNPWDDADVVRLDGTTFENYLKACYTFGSPAYNISSTVTNTASKSPDTENAVLTMVNNATSYNNEWYYFFNLHKLIQANGMILIDDDMAKSNKWLTNAINGGFAYIKQFNEKTQLLEDTSVSTNTSLQEVSDEILLKKAEAKYEADIKRIDMKERKYDTDLAAIESERNAIKQEMETLKTVAKDNVERTFKLFS